MNITEQPAPRLSPLIRAADPYRPPRHPAPADLRLDGNEGPAPDPAVLDAAVAAGPEILRAYPRPAALEALLASRLGVEPERVVVTAGADDALERALRCVLGPGRELILPVPAFEMIERYAALTGCDVIRVPWIEGPFPADEVLARVSERTAAVVAITPNSPTGLAATAADLERLSRGAPGALLIVDLAYTEFADEDLTPAALALPNAVAIRSLSKAWGLAGARVGYAAGPAGIVSWLRAAGHPYAVSGPSLAAARSRLETGGEAVRAWTGRVREERAALAGLLERLGAAAASSQANFVLGRFADAAWVRDALSGLGIAVRAFPGTPGLEDALRITLPGNEAGFARLCRALETALRPQALLFDMDDTLADASRSYRAATVATAAAFGVRITLDDITAAKAAGDANDDWKLTWRMVREGGVEVSLAEVTARFEELYQDAPGRPGLRATETLLVDRVVLERLAARLPLGIVTGRPRRDAEIFLDDHGIRDLFGALVTMDDGPLKPDPAPIRLALSRLGIERAIMIGDTPDDVRAARAAGVVPVGVIAPADDPAAARDALFAAGAARVLERAAGIEEVL
jgi:HAD superfamily hydrolase (TIGR01548 family)